MVKGLVYHRHPSHCFTLFLFAVKREHKSCWYESCYFIKCFFSYLDMCTVPPGNHDTAELLCDV